MIIDFVQNQIIQYEKLNREAYVGYFSPNGKLIDFNTLIGENHHETWKNPVSKAFLTWVSYIVRGTCIKDLIDNQYPGLNESVIRGFSGGNYYFNYQSIDDFLQMLDKRIDEIKRFKKLDDYLKFEYDLLLFFKCAYRNKRFFDSIQRKIIVENPNVVKERLRNEYSNCDLSEKKLELIYCDYLKKELLSYFKDICVQYLGYDSLERFKVDGTEIKLPFWYEKYDFNFLANPRIITSSYPNVNERYYIYLVMGWAVHRLPKYYYNEQTGLFGKSNFWMYYQSEKEKILEEEIQSIKRLVPLEERIDYVKEYKKIQVRK